MLYRGNRRIWELSISSFMTRMHTAQGIRHLPELYVQIRGTGWTATQFHFREPDLIIHISLSAALRQHKADQIKQNKSREARVE